MDHQRRNRIAPAAAARAGATYFGLVFAVGFLLGSVRVSFLVPRLGERWAELIEMPFMGVAIYLAARYVVRRFALSPRAPHRLLVGGLALALLGAAELGLAALLQRLSPVEYIAGRDPISGSAYLAMLALFALAPWLLTALQRRTSSRRSRGT